MGIQDNKWQIFLEKKYLIELNFIIHSTEPETAFG